MMGECNKPGDQLDSPKWPNIIEKLKKKKKKLTVLLLVLASLVIYSSLCI